MFAGWVVQEKAKVRDCAKKAEKWLFQKLDQQANFPPSKNPVRAHSLFSFTAPPPPADCLPRFFFVVVVRVVCLCVCVFSIQLSYLSVCHRLDVFRKIEEGDVVYGI